MKILIQSLSAVEDDTATASLEMSGCLHPTEDRRFSVREMDRLQSFPDGFTFIGITSYKYKMIGNAVPLNLAKAIGIAIKEQYFSDVLLQVLR